jgi:predicted dehydrogenase
MNQNLKIAIIGAGVFGSYYAEKCFLNPNADLVGLFDQNFQKAEFLAKKYNARAYSSLDEMLSDVNAVIISTPAISHGNLAIKCLKLNKHCLIEKPIASSLAQAKEILSMSDRKPIIIQIGHQERIISNAIGLDSLPEKPQRIISQRLTTPSERGRDVSVSLDLMIHDLDLILMLMQEEPEYVIRKKVIEAQDFFHHSTAEIKFKNAIATLTADRTSNVNKRSMELVYPSGFIKIDFHNKKIIHNTDFKLNENFYKSEDVKDSLKTAANSFIESVLLGNKVTVSAKDGYNALKLALKIDKDSV